MPIPGFDHNSVLPPHLGDPAELRQLSPYRATVLEVVQHFGKSEKRREILGGLLDFRTELMSIGLNEGFHLLDGSFLENIELKEARPPRDLDLVTFVWGISAASLKALGGTMLFNHDEVKRLYKLDHYWVTDAKPELLIELTMYWTGLFGHSRDSVWKGMLGVELASDQTDKDARDWLASTPLPAGGAP